MKILYKKIALTLIFVLGIINISPTIQAYANTTYNNSFGTLLLKNENNISIPNLNLSEEEIKLANEYIQNQINSGNIAMMPRSAVALAGSFFIPGVGQAVVTAAGVIIVGGAVVSAGSWLGKKVTSWIQTYKFNSSAEKAVNKAGKDSNKINHIMNPKHNWNKFFRNPKWNNVAPILTKVLKDGSERWERANIYVRKLYYKGQTVEVRFIKDSNGFIQAISTAWVK